MVFQDMGATWANEMNFSTNHAPGAESITQSVDQQSSVLPLCYGYTPMDNQANKINFSMNHAPRVESTTQTVLRLPH